MDDYRNRRRRRKRRRRRVLGRYIFSGIVLMIFALGISGLLWIRGGTSEHKKDEKPAYSDEYIPDIPSITVGKPIQRTPEEVLRKLEELGETDSRIKEIGENPSRYPDEMLSALANNPEMVDFVYEYPTAEAVVRGGIRDIEKEQKFPLLLQWDSRWAYVSYGDSIIGLAGCGPTCVSMVLISLREDYSLTPDVIAAYSVRGGHYVENVGTAWSLMEDAPKAYGLNVFTPTFSEEGIKNVLDEGGMVICSVGAGDFTTAGHFIVLYGYDEEGFKVHDPNCVARSRQQWSFDTLKGQIKNLWGYTK